MRIYHIAKVIIDDPKLVAAANEVIDQNKSVREVADKERVNIDELADMVVDLRRERNLYKIGVADLILQEFDRVRETKKVEKKIKSLGIQNISLEDIVWLLRRKRPNNLVHVLPHEAQIVVELREQGKTWEEIERKTRIGKQALRRFIKQIKPDMVKTLNNRQFGDEIYAEYLNIINKQDKAYIEVIKYLAETHEVTTRDIRNLLANRGITSDNPKKNFTQDEKNKIMELAYGGMATNQIAKMLVPPRAPPNIRDYIRKTDPEFYEKHIAKKSFTLQTVPWDIKRLIVDCLDKGMSFAKIRSEVQKQFQVLVGQYLLVAIKNEHNAFIAEELREKQNLIEEIPQEKTHEKTQQDWMNELERYAPSLYRAKQMQQSNEVTPEEIAYIEEIKKNMMGSQKIAQSINWYKQAQSNVLSVAHVGSLQNNYDLIRFRWVKLWLMKEAKLSSFMFRNDYINLESGRDFLKETTTYDIVILHHIFNPEDDKKDSKNKKTGAGDYSVSSLHSEQEWRKRLSDTGARYIFVFGGLGEVAVDYLGNIPGYKLIVEEGLTGVYSRFS